MHAYSPPSQVYKYQNCSPWQYSKLWQHDGMLILYEDPFLRGFSEVVKEACLKKAGAKSKAPKPANPQGKTRGKVRHWPVCFHPCIVNFHPSAD